MAWFLAPLAVKLQQISRKALNLKNESRYLIISF